MASNNSENSETLGVINIPKIAFRSFVHIAEKNLVDGNLAQTFCYFLGPPQTNSEDEIWIDTIVIPKQICSDSSVEDNGIYQKDTITSLRKMSLTKKKKYLLGSIQGLLVQIFVNSPQWMHNTISS